MSAPAPANAPANASAKTAAAPARAALSPPVKRSLTLSGHRTSVSLEPMFWDAFRALAARRGLGLNALASRIDAERPPQVGLAGAIRQAVLADLQARVPEG